MIERWLSRIPGWLAATIVVGALFTACCVVPAIIEALL